MMKLNKSFEKCVIKIQRTQDAIDKLTCEIMENRPLGSPILRVLYFPVKHSRLHNKLYYIILLIYRVSQG